MSIIRKKVMRKRSTSGALTERIVRGLKGGLRKYRRKVASEPESRRRQALVGFPGVIPVIR